MLVDHPNVAAFLPCRNGSISWNLLMIRGAHHRFVPGERSTSAQALCIRTTLAAPYKPTGTQLEAMIGYRKTGKACYPFDSRLFI
jgi:hypothetical protein